MMQRFASRPSHHAARRRRLLMLLAPLLLVACSTSDSPPLPSTDAHVADAAVQSADSAVIPGRFIVTVRDGVEPDAVADAFGLRPDFTYRAALNGFAGPISEAARAGLMRDARVLRVEPDRTVHAWETPVSPQSDATWGLDRIDQPELPLDDTYHFETTAAGVTAYIIDTGIRYGHREFGDRASFGFDAFGDGQNGNDCNGHGTHVAGTVGGTEYGVAKGVSLVAVRVLNCSGSGTVSGVVAGIDWVTKNHVKPAVANMSLGGGASNSLDDAVRNSVAAGITYAVAAGNGNRGGRQQDACGYSPARVGEALTVGATTSSDSKTSWSNYGDCVDIFAPGAAITSAWNGSDTATNTISGTSMAAPHVAGVAALYLESNPEASAESVFGAVFDNATKGVVTNSSTHNNHLLYSLFGTGGEGGDDGDPEPSPDPSAITLDVVGYKIQGLKITDLTWSGAASTNVDILRDGKSVATVAANAERHTDHTGQRGGASHTYEVCESGTQTCSDPAIATY